MLCNDGTNIENKEQFNTFLINWAFAGSLYRLLLEVLAKHLVNLESYYTRVIIP